MSPTQKAAIKRLVDTGRLSAAHLQFPGAVVVQDGHNRAFVIYRDGSSEALAPMHPETDDLPVRKITG